MEKLFIWKDKSGRGGVNNNLTLDLILEDMDETNWDGESLHEWAKDAEVGDEWENGANHYMCIKIV